MTRGAIGVLMSLAFSACADLRGDDVPGVSRPLALVYRGPGACPGCPESLARLIEGAGFAVRFVGPAALTDAETFAGAELYAQGGGDETMDLYRAVGARRWGAAVANLRAFVADGGRYLGVCLGGYVAGEWMDEAGTVPGLALLDGDVSPFTATPEDPAEDQVIDIEWLRPAGRRRVYFQEGPYFAAAGTPWARYRNGTTAVLVATYGSGKVAVSGVHLEAERDWYEAYDLDDSDGVDRDLGLALLRELMR